MICALSGATPKEPVVSPRSGAIFEKKLVETYVHTAGKDPINDQPLSVEELIPLVTETPPIVPPKPPSFNSIPTMLAAFQNEWDALALEVFTLRKQLHTAREELSLALYRYDAAVRVAARATSERDEAQNALAQLSETFAAGNGTEAPESPESPESPGREVPAAVLSRARDELFALHKSAKVSLPVTKGTEVAVSCAESALEIADALRFSVCASKCVVAGATNTVVVAGGTHAAKYDAVGFLSENGAVHAFGADETGLQFLEEDRRIGISIPGLRQVVAHPSEPLFVAASATQWTLADKEGAIYSSAAAAVEAIDIHVDGALLGVAGGGRLEIFDLTTTKSVSSIALDRSHTVTDIKFAYNGYWVVISSSDETSGKVDIYDLRKSTLVKTFAAAGKSVFAIDPSCQVLVTCQAQAQRLQVHTYNKKAKAWTENAAESEAGPLLQLAVESTAEEVQKTKTVKVCGLLSNAVVHYEVSVK